MTTQFLFRLSITILAGMLIVVTIGCKSETIGQKPGDEMNPAMSAQQKALNAEHKNKTENGLGAPQPQQAPN